MAGKLLKTILVVSLILNVILGYAYVIFQERENLAVLESQVKYLKTQNENLTRQLQNLKNKLEILQNQLEYYKNQANYYSSLLVSGNVSGEAFVGSSTVNLVAVRVVWVSFFEYYYEGVTMKGLVELRPGKGNIFVNTEPRIGIDLQTSVRTACLVAENITGRSLSGVDVTLTVVAKQEVDVVDGPSAGAAITCAIIAAIQDKKLNSSVYITGTINPDGKIGPVGGVLEKALAAAKEGAKIFLVPKGQSMVTVYVEKKKEVAPGFIIITREPKHVKLQDYLFHEGYQVKVFEVKNIQEAYKFMVSG